MAVFQKLCDLVDENRASGCDLMIPVTCTAQAKELIQFLQKSAWMILLNRLFVFFHYSLLIATSPPLPATTTYWSQLFNRQRTSKSCNNL